MEPEERIGKTTKNTLFLEKHFKNRIASQTIAAFRCLDGAKYMKNSRDFSFSTPVFCDISTPKIFFSLQRFVHYNGICGHSFSNKQQHTTSPYKR